MKNLRNLLLVVMSSLFVIAAVSPVLGQISKREGDRQPVADVIDQHAVAEAFRADLSAYLTELENTLQRIESIPGLSQKINKAGLDVGAALEKAKVGLAELSTEDLTRMREVYARYPQWREGPRAIDAIFEKVLQGRAARAKASGISPNVITPDDCPDLSSTPSFADLAITEGFVIAAEGVMEGFPTDGLTIAARIPAITAFTGLKAGLLAAQTLRAQYDDCHALSATDVQNIVDGAKTDIINNDNSNKTTITTAISTSKTDIINNDNANTTSIINNANANTTTTLTAITNAKNELKDLILRTQIEADLAQPDSDTFVGLYVTPTSQGGYLNLVRSIVVDTITKLAGSSTGQANSFLAKADDYKAAGNYKSAYQFYRKAYKAAVN